MVPIHTYCIVHTHTHTHIAKPMDKRVTKGWPIIQ